MLFEREQTEQLPKGRMRRIILCAPRGRDGRLRLKPVPGERPRIDPKNGDFLRGESGAILTERVADVRPPQELMGGPQREEDIDPKAIEGLDLWRVEINSAEPLLFLWAADEHTAIKNGLKEMGVVGLLRDAETPKARKFSKAEWEELKAKNRQAEEDALKVDPHHNLGINASFFGGQA